MLLIGGERDVTADVTVRVMLMFVTCYRKIKALPQFVPPAFSSWISWSSAVVQLTLA